MQGNKTHSQPGKKIEVTITFSDDLRGLLHPALRSCNTIRQRTASHSSIKDFIESLRIPHTEIGSLTINARQVDFSCRLKHGDVILATSTSAGVDPCRADLLRPDSLNDIRFLVDVNVAKLARFLRMAGFDSLFLPHLDDAAIAATAAREGRILLSRDRNLLKRKIITHGHLIRNTLPEKQLLEVLSLYGLFDKLKPFSRCIKCNSPLHPVKKDAILHRLEPLTIKYYSVFHHCRGCDSIYWSGSHRCAMDQLLARVRQD